jgi:hypothetical protein
LTSRVAFKTISGVVRFTEPALSSAPHSLGAQPSASGSSFTAHAGVIVSALAQIAPAKRIFVE